MEAENLFLLTSSMLLFLSRRSEGSHQIFHEILWIDSKLKPWQSTTSRSKTWKTCRTQRMWIRAQREFLGFFTTRDGRCQGWRVSMEHHWDICAVADVGWDDLCGPRCLEGSFLTQESLHFGIFWGSLVCNLHLPVCIPLFALDWPCIYGFGVGRFLHIVQPFGCRIYMPKV